MSVESPAKKKITSMRTVKTNPLDPVYKIGVNDQGKPINIGEISEQRPKKYELKRKMSNKDNLLSSLNSINWVDNDNSKKPKLFKKKIAGASSAVCNNTNLFAQIEKRGKKKCGDQTKTLEGILRSPKRRHHLAAKPPVPKSNVIKKKNLKS